MIKKLLNTSILILVIFCTSNVMAATLGTGSIIVKNPLESAYMSESKITLGFCEKNIYKASRNIHNGIDISVPKGHPVFSLLDGEVVKDNTSKESGDPLTDYWNSFLIVKYNYDGHTFYAYYGHVISNVKTPIKAGDQIATIRHDATGQVGDHLHLSISTNANWDLNGWGYDYSCGDAEADGYVDPLKYLTFTGDSTEPLVSNIDTALIIDSSGSMDWNDPLNNRLEAARYFIDRSEDLDYIAVIDFDDRSYVNPSNGTIRIVKDNRDNLKVAVTQVDSYGGTNIGEGLLAGYNQLIAGSASNQKIAILLTDGQSDSNHEDLSVQYTESYKNQGWQVYTIGLSDQADEDLLKYVAETTGGQYFKVSTEDAARTAITQIYQAINREVHRTGQTILQESLTLAQGQIIERIFNVSKNMQTLWADRIIPGSDVEMSLIQPDGKIIDRMSADSDDDSYHALGITYEIYRINNPMKGEWKVRLIGTDTGPEGEPTDLSVTVTPSSGSDDDDDGSCFIRNIINFHE